MSGLKKVSQNVIEEGGYDLKIVGIRKAEGGVRSMIFHNCFSDGEGSCAYYRPLFWFSDSDKREYESVFNIVHSKCYTDYGFKRTGCVCCPFGRELDEELKLVEKFEPNMYKAVSTVFKDSYEYTKQYREFQKKMRELKRAIKKELKMGVSK